MKYTIQIMDTDFNTVEFVVEARSKEEAMRLIFADIKAEDVAMSAVFEEGCNISLPVEPVDRYCIDKDATNKAIYWEAWYKITDYTHEQCNQCELDDSDLFNEDAPVTMVDTDKHIIQCYDDGLSSYMTQDWFNQFPSNSVPSLYYIDKIRASLGTEAAY